MAERDLAGKTALVTGASSGIGLAFARLLAARGANVIITARRAAELEKLAEELRSQHKIEVTVLPLDLSTASAAGQLFEHTTQANLNVDVLINNAGFGIHQDFVDIPWEKSLQQLQLNIVSLTELTYRFARTMVARGRGYILNVASIGAYTPTPSYATYSAGKAYVRDFTEALAYELSGTPVRVCCLCPGGTLTSFQEVAGQEVPGWMRPAFMSAERCAQIGLNGLFGWRRNVVSGISNKIGMWFLRFLPRRFIVWMAAMMMGKPHKPK